LAIAGIGVGAIVAALLLQGSLFDVRGTVDVPYPAGEVKEVQVLGLSLKVDGEPKPGASVLGAIALLMLATACFMTFAALRLAGAQRRLVWFWLIASAGLAVAATDELLAVHESIGHNLPFLADLPGVKRPDDLLLLLYLPGALAFGWWFRDVLREYRMTLWCMTAAISCFALSAVSDLLSMRLEEWFELLAGLFIAAGLVALMAHHLKRNLQIRVRVTGPPAESEQTVPARRPTALSRR
jgi:hypothetical protein